MESTSFAERIAMEEEKIFFEFADSDEMDEKFIADKINKLIQLSYPGAPSCVIEFNKKHCFYVVYFDRLRIVISNYVFDYESLTEEHDKIARKKLRRSNIARMMSFIKISYAHQIYNHGSRKNFIQREYLNSEE